ncbi:MAG: RNA polymerase sigma factor [Saprospiraceae bacterium]|nr:RNA polymerase sigma factor [Saprospiraceae bacterium]
MKASPHTVLLDLLQQQDEKSFDYLYENYGGALYSVILRVVKQELDAEEILQEAMINIWKNLSTYDADKGSIFTWMLNIARNKAIDYTRSKRFKQKNQTIEPNVDIGQQAQLNIEVIDLKDVVADLGQEYREVLENVYFSGYTHEQTSEMLGIPLGTVKTRVRKAIMILRDFYKVNMTEL